MDGAILLSHTPLSFAKLIVSFAPFAFNVFAIALSTVHSLLSTVCFPVNPLRTPSSPQTLHPTHDPRQKKFARFPMPTCYPVNRTRAQTVVLLLITPYSLLVAPNPFLFHILESKYRKTSHLARYPLYQFSLESIFWDIRRGGGGSPGASQPVK